MERYRYRKIDAFATPHSLGNPAACLYLDDGQALPDETMLDIARRHKGFVSEVVYCARKDGGIHLTYYSSECEVDFCGHGTIACMYALIANDAALSAAARIPVRTRRKGDLVVYNEIPARDAVLVAAPAPARLPPPADRREVADSLGIREGAISPHDPLDAIDAGLRTLIVPIADLADEISIFPDEACLKAFCLAREIDIVLIFSRAVANPAHIAHTRVFAPRFGYLEDPATGSGNSAFGHYMLRNGIWDGTPCSIEQGGEDRVPNIVLLEMRGDALLFGGRAVTRIEGTYFA